MLKAPIFFTISLFRGFSLTERLSKTTHTRRYRLSKKNPKRLTFLMKLDLGKVEQQIRVFAPQKSEVSNLEIPKEKNPNLVSFRIGTSTLAYYMDSQKGFIYDKLGFWSGSFEKHDLLNLYSKIGTFLKEIKTQKG